MGATENLANIPFEALIGGPLTAAVHAQAVAAQTSIDFIESIGFVNTDSTTTPTEVRNVTFKYQKLDDGVEKSFSLTVPVLSVVPIPYLRIDEMTIDFTAKLSDIDYSQTYSGSNSSVSGSFRAGWGWGRVKLRAGYSSFHRKLEKHSSSAEYTMDIHVRAVQDDLPKGMAKVLDILEGVILEKQDPPPSA